MWRRSIPFMLSVELLCSPASIRVPTAKFLGRIWRQHFVAAKKVLRSSLSVSSLEVRGLITEVQNKPQLDTRVRHRDPDTVGCCLLEGALEVWMFIAIEDTPDLVVRPSFAPPLLAGFAAPCLDCPIH